MLIPFMFSEAVVIQARVSIPNLVSGIDAITTTTFGQPEDGFLVG